MSRILKQYDYRPKKLPTLSLFLIALVGCALLAFYAVTVEGPMANARGIVLTKAQARLICGGFAILSPIGLYLLGSPAYAAFTDKRKLVLTDKQILLPSPLRIGIKNETYEIPLNTITTISVHDFIGKSKVIRLDYANCIANIHSEMMPSLKAFDELHNTIQIAVKLAEPTDPVE